MCWFLEATCKQLLQQFPEAHRQVQATNKRQPITEFSHSELESELADLEQNRDN